MARVGKIVCHGVKYWLVVRMGREDRPPGRREERSEGGRADRHADADEAQADLEQDVGPGRDRPPDEQGRNDVRHQVPPHDPAVRRADHVARLDELGAAQRQQVRADEPGRIERREEADQQRLREDAFGDDPAVVDELQRRTEPDAREDEEEQEREGHHRLGEARDGGVDDAAEVAGGGADRERDQQCEEDGAQADLERGAGAVEEPDQLVASERPVGAEDEQRRLPVSGPDSPPKSSTSTARVTGTCVHGPVGRRFEFVA